MASRTESVRMAARAPILGLDFGTTNTSAAFIDAAGKLRLVKATENSALLPSVVWYHKAGKALVGASARTQIIEDPRNTIFEVKRFVGRRFRSQFVAKVRERYAYELVEGPDGTCAVRVHGQVTPMGEVAARIIERIAQLSAAANEGVPFEECVLTAPAHATFRQREVLRGAAQKAGLRVLAIVNEPTAAALYYANLRNPHQTVLIFDLGGGTLDATLMSVEHRVVRVLATGGDAFLGGGDFDAAIANRFADRFAVRHGIDLRPNRVVLQRLAFAAETAKIALSTREQTRVRIPCVAQKEGRFLDFEGTLTRSGLEGIVDQLIERCAGACEDVLARAKIAVDQVDELVLVGGQTRMPAIRSRFAHFKRHSSDKDVHPELGVAVGAAVLGRNLARGNPGLQDVAPLPISLMAPGGVTKEVIAANSPVPCVRTVKLEGLPPWQAPVPVAIFETTDATSIEREVFGTVFVGAEWRVGKGSPSLQLELARDFSLKAKLIAPDGRVAPVVIQELRGGAR